MMNAILREREADVLTNEAIEVHLSYLRPAVEALGEKIDQANKDRIAGDAMLAEKIDQANQDRIAGDTMLAEKIDKTNEKLDQTNDRISKVQGSIDGLKWFIASVAVIVSGLSIAHTFGWV
jgi:hypothetical protein